MRLKENDGSSPVRDQVIEIMKKLDKAKKVGLTGIKRQWITIDKKGQSVYVKF